DSSSTTRMEPLDMDRFPDCGEFNVEGRALAGSGANVDFSSVLLNDAIADGKAQSGASPARFGGEKGIEDAMDVIARNAGTGICHFDFHAAVVRCCSDFQHSAARHRVARVQEQIQKYLLELVGGTADGG